MLTTRRQVGLAKAIGEMFPTPGCGSVYSAGDPDDPQTNPQYSISGRSANKKPSILRITVAGGSLRRRSMVCFFHENEKGAMDRLVLAKAPKLSQPRTPHAIAT